MSDLIKEKKTYFSSAEIAALVRKKYPDDAYVVLEEVRDSTGFSGRGRKADAVAFGFWPSRGLTITGFEFKSSRSDWMSEIAKPEKAESIAQYCDSWWLVATEQVAKLEEIPPAWGWYAPVERAGVHSLKVMKSPPPFAALPSGALPRSFLMSCLRNMRDKSVPKGEVERLAQERAEQVADHRAGMNKLAADELARLQKVLGDFKKESGIDLTSEWPCTVSAKQAGAVIRAIIDGRLIRHARNVKEAAEKAAQIIETIEALPLGLREETGDE